MRAPRRRSEGSITFRSVRSWLIPPFDHEPLPLLAEHPAHALLSGEGRIVGNARGFGSLADGLPLDGDVPKDLPRPFVDPSPNAVLDFLGLAEQGRAFQRRAFVDLDTSQGVLQERPRRLVLE